MIDEFEAHPLFTFIAVRTDFGHGTHKDYGQRRDEADQYCALAGFPRQHGRRVLYLADNDRRDFLGFGFADPMGSDRLVPNPSTASNWTCH